MRFSMRRPRTAAVLLIACTRGADFSAYEFARPAAGGNWKSRQNETLGRAVWRGGRSATA
jgi:hypothetical protein